MRFNCSTTIFYRSLVWCFILTCLFSSRIIFSAEATEDNSATQKIAAVDFYNLSLADLGKIQVSIATGNATQLDKAPATATVIYATQIESMGARSLDDVLETVPGLHVSLSNLSRLDSVYSIRGIHTGFNPQVLLMLNGFPIKISVQGGRPTLFRLPIATIERVEIIRGPGSAIYGADAFAGVINVITKDLASIEKTRVGVRLGSFNTKDVWLETATEWKGFGIALTSELSKTNGDLDRVVSSDLQSILDANLGTQASLAPGALSTRYKIIDSHLAVNDEKLQFNLWSWMAINDGLGAGGAQALDTKGRHDANLLEGDLTYHFKKSEYWDHSVRLSFIRYNERNEYVLLPPGAVLPIGKDGNLNFATPVGVSLFTDGLIGNPGGLTRNSEWDLVSVYTGFDRHRIRMAVGGISQSIEANETKNFGPGVLDKTPLPSVVSGDLTDVKGTPYIFFPNRSGEMHYLSLQDEWQLITDLNLTSGIRYDNYSDVGSTTNPRLALVWANNEKLTTKLLLGSAFRAPSQGELYDVNNPVALGNPNLRPETIHTEELSFTYRPANEWQTTFTLFKYQARQMVDFVADEGATTKTAQNKRAQDGKGFEWEMSWRPSSQLSLNASYSLQKSEDTETKKAIPDAPEQQLKINMNWQFANQWSLAGQVYRVADRARAQGDLRTKIDDYTWINCFVTRKNVFSGVDASFEVRNATNIVAREPSSGTIKDDYPLESRSVWLGLTFSF